MNDYSDLILLLGVMVLYAVLMSDINRSLLAGTQYITDREVEYTAISLAQDVIDEARWIPYDQFQSTYESQTRTRQTPLGNYQIRTFTHNNSLSKAGISNNHTHLVVNVNSLFTPDTVSVSLHYVKNE